MIERRMAPRVPVTWTVEAENRAIGFTFDVSASGLSFLSMRQQNIGDVLEVELVINEKQRVRCAVRLLREQNTTVPRYNMYAGEFQLLDRKNKEVLTGVLSGLMAERDRQMATARCVAAR